MKDSKYLIQSNNYTTIPNDFGIYAQRMLVLLAKAMQYRFENANLRTGVVPYSEKKLEWRFNIADLNIGNGNNRQYIKRQLKNTLKAVIEIEKGESWRASTMFTDIDIPDNSGEFVVHLNERLWDIFVELSKGYKKYQIETAMQFSSAHALRLYQLFAGNQEPVTYGIAYLKKLFGVETKYKLVKDFIAYCIEKPIQEINEKAEYSVSYEAVYKTAGKGRPSIDALTFTIRPKAGQIQHAEIVRKYGLSMLPDKVKVKLIESYDFTKQGIKANAELLQQAYELMQQPTLMEFLDTKRAKAMKAKNPQGWIINAIAGELETLM